MRRFLAVSTLILVGSLTTGTANACVLYGEHVTDGTLDLTWFACYEANAFEAYTLNPEEDPCYPNPGGDGYVGKLVGTFAGPHALGSTLSGDGDLGDYRVDVWICVGAGNAKRGILFRSSEDCSMGYQLILDAGMFTLMFRYADGGMMPITIASWSAGNIPGGIPAVNTWHKFSIEGIGDQFYVYWDDVLLDGCPVTHGEIASGYFGLYLFSAEPTDITLIADDIVASDFDPSAVDQSTWGAIKRMYVR
ncbi:MAG: hypothetical protein KAW17_06005 [Candidatus Eisenbacteria sp.]|nr:hypothetical protein [Candidatus Eisenbacteria bacterium]